jgi:solute carrier family 35 protein F5
VSLSDTKPPTPTPTPTPHPEARSTLIEPHRNRPALGDALALVSALFYAFYVTLLKVRVGDERRIDMRLFFGLVGLFNLAMLWPVGVLCHVTGVERFELPHGHGVITSILLNVCLPRRDRLGSAG